ncbi:MAG: hypothetical protein ACI4GA_05655 [Acutalibacteraceae bacterium]|nr:hypothetical protein [Oscillospiraceae bacterium]
MAEWFSQYWYLVIVFFAVLAATIFGTYKASKAYKRHNRLFHEEEEKMKRLVELKQKFEVLTEDTIDSADDGDLLEGVALSYQLKLQKQADMTAEFEKLPIQARYIYTLDIFSSEGAVVSEFYRNNGKELKDLLVPALRAIGESEEARLCVPISSMFDDDSEVSIDKAKIDETDAAFKNIFDLNKFKLAAAKYIRDNKTALI